VRTASDFAVRDWLKDHQVPAPTGATVWPVGTIRDLLLNRRYIADIEINKKNKGIEDLHEAAAYRVVKAPHEPLVPLALFELAEAVRREKGNDSPNRVGRPRSYSHNQCERVYPLQSRMFCARCGHSMTPYYVMHKPNEKEKRRSTCYIHYYICAQQQMHGRKHAGHSNRVSAKASETWLREQLRSLMEAEGVVERAVEMARAKCADDLGPQQEALGLCHQAKKENQIKIDRLLESVSSGEVSGPLLAMLNGRASELQREQERLKIEERELEHALRPVRSHFDTDVLRNTLRDFDTLCEAATPEEMQRLVRTLVHRIEWHPDGDAHTVELSRSLKARWPQHKTSRPHARTAG